MCGIVGIITKASNGFTWPQADLFEEMLVCDAIRGTDSTGMFGVNKTGNATYIKLASHPFNLIKTPEYIAWKQEHFQKGKIAVGHNRKATTGAITNGNAHPFVFGPVLLVHNGNIENFRSLVHYRERDKHNIEVDSHAVALLMARNEPADIIKELHGAFTLMWYNTATKKLHLVTNGERPMSMVETADGSYYASEKGMLRWLLRRRSNKAEIAELKKGALVTVDIDGKSEVKEVKLYEKPTYVDNGKRFNQGNYPTASRHEPLVVDNDGVIHLPVQHKNTHKVMREIPMTKEHSFNVHYGADKEIVLEGVKWPQIVFSIDDYKKVSEDQVDPPVWRMWGPALDSKSTQVYATFRGTDAEIDELAYAPHVIGHIDKIYERKVDLQLGVGVNCILPRRCEITVTPQGLPITKEHLEYMNTEKMCLCGHVEVKTICNPEEDYVMYIRDGFKTEAVCKWCVEGTQDCERLCGSDKVGTCTYCKNAKEERQKAKDAAPTNPAV